MKKTIEICDMCRRVITDDPELSRNTGSFYRTSWGGEYFELCGPCADRVQKFIHGKEEEQ